MNTGVFEGMATVRGIRYLFLLLTPLLRVTSLISPGRYSRPSCVLIVPWVFCNLNTRPLSKEPARGSTMAWNATKSNAGRPHAHPSLLCKIILSSWATSFGPEAIVCHPLHYTATTDLSISFTTLQAQVITYFTMETQFSHSAGYTVEA